MEKHEIDYAIRQERHYRDFGHWEKLREMWHNDPAKTLVDISWFTGQVTDWIHACKAMQSRGNLNVFHTLQPVEILINDDRAVATTLICIHGRTTFDERDLDLQSWAHQVQRLVKLDGVWKFVRFEAIYIQDSLSPAVPGQKAPDLDGPAKEVLQKSRPPVKHVALLLSIDGKTVRNDLPGYDDEATWRPLVERNDKWLKNGRD